MFFNVYILPHAWQLISAVHLLFIIFVLFFERQGSARRMAWLLALVFLPVVGMLLYIMFSGHFFTRTKRMIKTKRFVYMQMAPFYQIQHDFFISHADDIADPRIRENLPFITINLTRGASLLSFSDSIKFFCWGEDLFERLCGELAAAKSSIHLEYFTFRNDATGRRILSILCDSFAQHVGGVFINFSVAKLCNAGAMWKGAGAHFTLDFLGSQNLPNAILQRALSSHKNSVPL